MSLKTLPILFLNLGGEMMYILDQRLRAQNIAEEKAKKVMHDILSTMLNKRFMDELFKPQDAYSKKAMRTVFDRLAHASIMRLNAASMDKLYDLMTMALKYQVSLSKQPYDVLMVTLNHMDAIREFARGNEAILTQIENVYALIKENYENLTIGQFQLIRQTLLSFFQDMHIRVSIFLKDNVQTSNGRFILPKNGQVPWGSDTPGAIRFFDDSGMQRSVSTFEVEQKYQLADKIGTFELLGDRVTKYGCNMYKASRNIDTTIAQPPSKNTGVTRSKPGRDDVSDELAKAELNLLEYLISGKKTEGKADFRLNLFDTDKEEENAEEVYVQIRREIVVDASQRQQRQELKNLMDEFSIDPSKAESDGDDLLALMDSTSK